MISIFYPRSRSKPGVPFPWRFKMVILKLCDYYYLISRMNYGSLSSWRSRVNSIMKSLFSLSDMKIWFRERLVVENTSSDKENWLQMLELLIQEYKSAIESDEFILHQLVGNAMLVKPANSLFMSSSDIVSWLYRRLEVIL